MSVSRLVNDRSEPTVLRVCKTGAVEVDYRAHYAYVDNIGVFAVASSRTRKLLDQVMKKFNGIGRARGVSGQSHRVEEPGECADQEAFLASAKGARVWSFAP